MKIGILGTADRRKSWPNSGSEDNSQISWVQNSQVAGDFNLFIDLNFDAHPERIRDYAGNAHTLFLLSAVNCTPEMAFHQENIRYGGEQIFGINAIPGFLERSIAEVSNPFELNTDLLHPFKSLLHFENYEWVKSRVGMVTPRIVFMIINEAFFTQQEGTATAPDIDTAMKLGTAYPHGPFEWMERCGIDNVYQTLEALYADTHDERYKVCPALKTAYLKNHI